MQPVPLDLTLFGSLPDRARPAFTVPTLGESAIAFPQADFTIRSETSQPSRSVTVPVAEPTLGEQLFDATAQAKIWTSKVAMHLDPTTRKRFFSQLDRLHDEDEWVGADLPVNLGSYKGLIRTVVKFGIDNGPSLALMPSGNLLAMWEVDSNRLSIEFIPNDRARWVLSRKLGEYIERAAGETAIERLKAVLEPYDADGWFVGR